MDHRHITPPPLTDKCWPSRTRSIGSRRQSLGTCRNHIPSGKSAGMFHRQREWRSGHRPSQRHCSRRDKSSKSRCQTLRGYRCRNRKQCCKLQDAVRSRPQCLVSLLAYSCPVLYCCCRIKSSIRLLGLATRARIKRMATHETEDR